MVQKIHQSAWGTNLIQCMMKKNQNHQDLEDGILRMKLASDLYKNTSKSKDIKKKEGRRKFWDP